MGETRRGRLRYGFALQHQQGIAEGLPSLCGRARPRPFVIMSTLTSPAPSTSPRAPSDSVFRHPAFRRFQAARFLSVLGFQMQSVVIGWEVYARTHRAIDLGYVGLAQFVPFVALALVSGHLSDRVDRRRIVLVCNVAYAACSLLLFYVCRRSSQVAPIYAILVLLGASRSFSGPANQSLLPHLVPPAQFSRAVAWSSSIWQVATIAGPALGGEIYALSHGGAAVYLSAFAFSLVSAALIWSLKTPVSIREKTAASWATLLAGVTYVWRRKIVLGSISLDLFAVLLGGAVALLPAYASDVLHVGAAGLGRLRAAPAIGAMLVAMLLAYRPLRKRAGATMFACVFLFGLSTIVFALSRSFMLSLFALLVAGAADMVSVVVRQTLVQIATPDEMRGRVSSVNLVFIGASNELGEFESGLTAALFGLVPAALIGGLGTCLVVGIWAFLFPELRRVDRLEDVKG
jgi:MFS family permease